MTYTNRRFKDEIFEQFARIGKAFANAKRIELLDLLSQGERHVEALADAASISLANASRMKDLPKDREIVAYCRGPYCVMAVEALARLRQQGLRVEQGAWAGAKRN